MKGKSVGAEVAKVITTVLWSEAVTLASLVQRPLGSASVAYVLIILKVKTTSCEVKGWPSDQVTPERRVKVSVLPSVDHWWPVASTGVSCPLMPLTNSSVS